MIDIQYQGGDIVEMTSASDIAIAIENNGGPGSILFFRPSIQLISRDTTPTPPMEPKWVSMEEMSGMPRGWYWAAFPGCWEWFSPDLGMTKGIDHGTTKWVELMSLRYWGPFTGPPVDVSSLEKSGPSVGKDKTS